MKERREGGEREERGEAEAVGWLADAGVWGGRRRAALEVREAEDEEEGAEGCVSDCAALCRLLAGEKKSRAACEPERRCDEEEEEGRLVGKRSSFSETRDKMSSIMLPAVLTGRRPSDARVTVAAVRCTRCYTTVFCQGATPSTVVCVRHLPRPHNG